MTLFFLDLFLKSAMNLRKSVQVKSNLGCQYNNKKMSLCMLILFIIKNIWQGIY